MEKLVWVYILLSCQDLDGVFRACPCRYDGNALLSCIEVYNQQTESWELLDKGMTTQRCDAGLTVVHLR